MTTVVPLHRLCATVRALRDAAGVVSPLPVETPALLTDADRVPPTGPGGTDAVGAPVCRTCNVTFENHMDQRAHFKSPWHLENVKRGGLRSAAVPECVGPPLPRAPVRPPMLYVRLFLQ